MNILLHACETPIKYSKHTGLLKWWDVLHCIIVYILTWTWTERRLAYLGRLLISLKKSMVNFLGPVLPLKALKPSKGTLEVPVTNWKKTKSKSSVYQRHILFSQGYTSPTLLLCQTYIIYLYTCKSRSLCSLSNISTACQNHWTTGCSGWYPDKIQAATNTEILKAVLNNMYQYCPINNRWWKMEVQIRAEVGVRTALQAHTWEAEYS